MLDHHGMAPGSDRATGSLLLSHQVTGPPLHFWLGAGALLASHVLVCLRVEPLYTYFFSFAWWPYILWIDGWVYWRTGHSLLLTQPRTFVAAAFWSIAGWCLYEAFNFRLQNWYYVMTPEPAWAYRLNYAVGFATVFPGLFETAALLSSFGMFPHWRTPSFVVTPRLLSTIFVSGLLATLLPLLWPLLFFPLIWISMALLFEPLVYQWRGRSLLAELARGEPQRLAGHPPHCRCHQRGTLGRLERAHPHGLDLYRTMAGLVPYIRDAAGGVCGLSAVSHRMRGPLECAGPLPSDRCRTHRHDHCALRVFPRSTAHLCRDCTGLDRTRLCRSIVGRRLHTMRHWPHSLASLPEVTACAAAGLQYPYELLHAVHQRGQERVATKLRLPSERVQELVDASHLGEFRGIGMRNLPLLQAAGITRFEELARQESAAFTASLQHLGEASGVPPPYERQVRGWIDAAQRWTARHR